jgi:hypothetical protein
MDSPVTMSAARHACHPRSERSQAREGTPCPIGFNRMPRRESMNALAVAIVGAAGAAWYGAWRVRRSLENDITQLTDAGLASPPEPVDWSSLDGLPRPVADYLRHAIGQSASRVRVARLHQRGGLRTDGRSVRWMHFDAAQVVVPASCAFIWNASVDVVGPLKVRVIDALANGTGSGRVLLQSAVKLSGIVGGLEMNSGALHRYLAESVWYPTSLLPSRQLRWEPVDDRRAIATLSTRSATVSLEFWFDGNAEVIGIYSPRRWGRFKGRFEEVPWEGHFSDYAFVDGLRVPSKGEVGWYLDGRWRSVWSGTLVQALYEY